MKDFKYLGMGEKLYYTIIFTCIILTIFSYIVIFDGSGRTGFGQLLGIITIFRSSVDFKDKKIVKYVSYIIGILMMFF